MDQFETFLKNEDAILDWKFDWVNWLGVGETLLTHEITVTDGLTMLSSSITDNNTSVTVWLSGGTLGVTYQVDCLITASAPDASSRTEKRSILIRVTDR